MPHPAVAEAEAEAEAGQRKPRILVAGGGVGGLVLTLVAKRRGFEVQVFEKHLSAIRGEGRETRSPCSTPSTPTSPARSPPPDASWAIASTASPTASPANRYVEFHYKKNCLRAIGSNTVLLNKADVVVDFREYSNKV
ncbi:hypothetical protein C4D60_Mb04t00630 [Musa balbisiana]|uniref:FAD-binding domain-containing protein n=1 Tax=Musa balbisiana TaxID=52838 RepID=A0A4V4H9F2_MUSBA|nr:hypothetical protein C4D60_Mb04t00630 [Musa balbisiana]